MAHKLSKAILGQLNKYEETCRNSEIARDHEGSNPSMRIQADNEFAAAERKLLATLRRLERDSKRLKAILKASKGVAGFPG